jgi:hypothetical protein
LKCELEPPNSGVDVLKIDVLTKTESLRLTIVGVSTILILSLVISRKNGDDFELNEILKLPRSSVKVFLMGSSIGRYP